MKFQSPTPISVIEALRKLYPDSSRRTLQNWLQSGRFSVDGVVVKKEADLLQGGQTLSSRETFRPPKIPGLPILYEDRYLIAIDKPVGLLSTPLETSGALLFARGKNCAEKLNLLFEQHDLTRQYFAIIEGRLKEDSGTWECPLLELPNMNVVESIDGKMATTHFEVQRRSAKYTYIKLTLETGKKHQIHAIHLGLIHPFTQKPLSIRSPLPRVFEVLGGKF
jgi:23S rRNA-/tRNA-specific pseudouridylate synthase